MLRHHNMADALAVIHMRQVLLACPVPGNAHNLAGLVVPFRHVVIHHQYHARLVPNLGTQFFEHGFESARPRRVVKHGQVNLAVDNLARPNTCEPGSPRDQLLRQGLRVDIDVRHSGLAPENFTTLAQRWISPCTNFENSSGELPTGTAPSASSRRRTSGVAMA